MMRWLAVVLVLVLVLALKAAHAVPLDVPDGPLATAASRVPANLLINLSLTYTDAAAAHDGPYLPARDYGGYFHSRLCYGYPVKTNAAGVPEAALDEASGYFAPRGESTAQGCGGAFSGNFLNWASASKLDLLRLGLTGGDRVLDAATRTVLQRAWLPDGRQHADFYAHADWFARKSVSGAVALAATPFGDATLFIVNCRNRILFSNSATGGGCDAARLGKDGKRIASDKYHGEFLARVQVCSGADRRADLCQVRGGALKPEGALQAVPDARIGLMSYLSESGASDAALYGGVLRAPLKLLGAEWDEGGRLVPNPDRAGGALSGTINTINQLGRSNPARRGAYKGSDPGAELYYEALRYLQGREAGGGGGPTDDGLPVWHSRSDPVTTACQRNTIATIGHAAFQADRYLPGNTRTDRGDGARPPDGFVAPALDIMAATRRVGAFEADPMRSLGNGAPRPELLELDTRDDGQGSYYLAGAAHWAHINPIRKNKPVTVRSIALELGSPNAAGASALYLAAKYGAFDDRNADGNPFISSGGQRGNSEWSQDGRTPIGYFAAPRAADIVEAARGLIASGAGAAGVRSGPAALGPGGGFLIQTAYDSAHWHGSLQRHNVSVAPDGSVSIAASAAWEAAGLLAPASRQIYTLASQDGQAQTVPFTWADLPPQARAYLSAPAPGAPADNLGEARTAWLRGERGQELGQPGGLLRRRGGLLGDIMFSTPLVTGAPSPGVVGEGYRQFHDSHRNRRSVVYVGANDGMLHAFDAGDGRELFAYIPAALLPQLSLLADPRYRHRAYADGSAAHGEALVGGRWRSVLAAGMGMGARGVFALDVTQPGSFGKTSGALWEFTERDDPAIGHVRAPPQIARLRLGGMRYGWFVLVSSGINPASDNGEGALFLLSLDKPAGMPWRLGVNYHRISTPPADSAAPNMLAPPALAIGADGAVLYAYAGDIQGQLWRADLSGGPAGVRLHKLFDARDAGGRRQPIAQAPRLLFAPGQGYLLLFGTGRYLEAADTEPASYAVQSMYAIHDKLGGNAPTRAALVERHLQGAGPYTITGAAPDYGAEDAPAGWWFDLPQARSEGERAAGLTLRSGTVVLDTILPGRDACAAPAMRSYVLDALSGTVAGGAVAGASAETGALLPGIAAGPPLVLEAAMADGARNPTGAAVTTRSYVLLRPQGSPGTQIRFQTRSVSRRLSWREVANWPELHQAAQQ